MLLLKCELLLNLGSGIRSLEYGVWDTESGIRSLGYGVWDTESGIRSLGYGVWRESVVCLLSNNVNNTSEIIQETL